MNTSICIGLIGATVYIKRYTVNVYTDDSVSCSNVSISRLLSNKQSINQLTYHMHPTMRKVIMINNNHIMKYPHQASFSLIQYPSVNSKRWYRSDKETWYKLHSESINPKTRERFWDEQAKKLHWFKPYESVLSFKDPKDLSSATWFKGGETNLCYNAIDRHVINGDGDQIALYYDSPVTNTKSQYTYKQLQEEVSKTAAVLASLGVKKGDRVLLYMPMIPEAVISMLATLRLGAIHSVVFGGFASKELAIRIDDAKPHCIITASCGVEPGRTVEYAPLLKHALEIAKHKPAKVLFKRRKGNTASGNESLDKVGELKDVIPEPLRSNGTTTIHDYDVERSRPTIKSFYPATPVAGDDTSYVLYTSGTTGTPKGIVRDTGGYQTALRFCMEKLMQAKKGDCYLCTSDIGWVVGHSFIVYGPLLGGLKTVLYEGKPVGTPDAAAFWRLASEYKANALYTAPTAMRAIRKVDPNLSLASKHDLTKLEAIFCAGERGDPETIDYFSKTLKIPVIDNFWQTETGWPVISWHDEKIGVKPGSASRPVPGFDVRILDVESSKEVPPETMGELCLKLPLPPGTLTTVLNNPARFQSAYMKAHP